MMKKQGYLATASAAEEVTEMGQDIEQPFLETLKSQNFLLQIDECTILKSEALLLAYMRCIDKKNLKNVPILSVNRNNYSWS